MHWKILSLQDCRTRGYPVLHPFSTLADIHWCVCICSTEKERFFVLLSSLCYTCSSAYWFSQYMHNDFASSGGVLWSAFASDYLSTTWVYSLCRKNIAHTKKKGKREDLWFDLNQCVLLCRTKWIDCGTCRSEFILYNNLWRLDHIP